MMIIEMIRRCFGATRLNVCHPVRPQTAFLHNYDDNSNIIMVRKIMMISTMMLMIMLMIAMIILRIMRCVLERATSSSVQHPVRPLALLVQPTFFTLTLLDDYNFPRC